MESDNTFKSNGIIYGFWATQRPLTKKWGSGQVFDRITETFGQPDIVFGKTDGIPRGVDYIDKDDNLNWNDLAWLSKNKFLFGYWDPPYPPAVKGLMKPRSTRDLESLQETCYTSYSCLSKSLVQRC